MWDLLEKAVLLWGGIDLIRKLAVWMKVRFASTISEEELQRSITLKEEMQKHLVTRSHDEDYGRAIIRNVVESCPYPDGDSENRRQGISNWFRVDIKGFYHKGLEVYLDVSTILWYDPAIESWSHSDLGTRSYSVSAYKIGRIPYRKIRRVDWEGDNYYPEPHVYCTFDGIKGSPYEDYIYYYRPEGMRYLRPIDDFRPWARYNTPFWRTLYRLRRLLHV